MSNFSALISQINANIKQNGNREITGAVLNAVLRAMVTNLGEGYTFGGFASPSSSTAPNPDYPVFYILSEPGTYTQLGGVVVASGEIVIATYDDEWNSETILDYSVFATRAEMESVISEVQGRIDVLQLTKADKSTTYTKTEIDGFLADVAHGGDLQDLEDYVNRDFAKKANVYTKTEVDDKFAGVVHKTGNEDVQGQKNFKDGILVEGELLVANFGDDGNGMRSDADLLLSSQSDHIRLHDYDRDADEEREIEDLIGTIFAKADTTDLTALSGRVDSIESVLGDVNELLETI